MKIIRPSIELIDPPSYDELLHKVEIAGMLLSQLKELYPVFFEDIEV